MDTAKTIEADICIIGGGAAGISIARALIGSGIRVCLLESGGFEYDDDTQSLYDGANIGMPYYPLQSSRLRYFGGTTNHWAGWCAPLNAIDFEPRPWIPHSGWPIRKQDLEPYYLEAQKTCRLGPYVYEKGDWAGKGRVFPEFRPDKLVTRFWQISRPVTRFGEVYRDALENARNIRIYLYANVTRLDTNEAASQIHKLHARALNGKEGEVRAKYYVLACGGIENPRLLLLSHKRESAGIGNRHRLVGRFFMEHINETVGNVLASDPKTLHSQFSRFQIGNTPVLPGICPSASAQEHNRTLNYGAWLEAAKGLDTGYHALKALKHDLLDANLGSDLGTDIWRVITDLDTATEGLWRHLRGQPVRFFAVRVLSEQSPNPASRVILGEELDRFGQRRASLDWRLSSIDKRTIRIVTQLVAEEFGRLNMGRLHPLEWVMEGDDVWPSQTKGGWHHMGTTRMADNPNQGVVDRNCRVHGIGNLFIAGSSVFPTGGYANPTLTIVALAQRLSDHLKSLFTLD